jgi:membrane protease YdiL (CAAX protease family)
VIRARAVHARGAAIGWIGAAAGLILLATRPAMTRGPVPAALALGSLYLVLLAMSVAGPVARPRSRVHPLAALAVGLAAVALAGVRTTPVVAVTLALTPVLLNTLAAVAEEALFRRLLYDRLARWGGAAAVVVTAVLFAAVHVPAYGWAVVPVDLGAGLLFGWQRWASGSWLVPAATHVAANLVVMFR